MGSPRTKRKRSSLHRHSPDPEHGDWRVSLDKPEEAEHLRNPSVNVWRRTHVKVEMLQSAPWGMLAQHPVNEFYEEGARAEEEEPPVVPISGWSRFLRLFVAWFLLLPLSVVMVFALMLQLYHAAPAMGNIGFWLSEPVWFSLLGALVFASLMLGRLAEPVLIYVYVLGHELTHALAAKLCGGKVQSFSIDFDGGYVETDTDNVFIALAPYFVPFWMLCWMLLLWLANLAYPFASYGPWFCAGFGFWWSFHLYWTVWVIPREQPDMLENGMVFSLLVVILMNILGLLVALCCFGAISPIGYAHDLVHCAWRICSSWSDMFLYWQSLCP